MNSSLQIARIVSRPFEENTYIAHLEGRDDCIVFDPGLEPDKILEHLDEARLTPAALLITHGHGDHIGGNAALKERWPQCPLVIGVNDAPKLTDPQLNLSAVFGLPFVSPSADRLLNDGELYSAAGMEFEVREIPGHSIGHVVFVYRGEPLVVFGGDVLFAGSVGRCDIPDGNFKLLSDGIRQKLYTLPDETIVLPGHGPATKIGQEKRTNPFVNVRGEH